ncbi:SDR family NAD(P)-dependent oxidoreductase [Paenibacillus sp. MBLB4367]|uniref:SDR family NAD(P)-dependent oxidoreductase n=1 Tax=Paenibacillus sp. MBLB4367 TaxID=3384767 RepID=UPI0039081740
MRLKGKRALVTGAAQGIGLGVATRFVQEGASVILLDVRTDELAAAAAQLQQLDVQPQPEVRSVVCDLSDPSQVEQAADFSWSCFGGVDILVNNAGIAVREPFTSISLERWRKIIDVNLNGTFILSQNICKRMIEAGIQGSVVNMASKNGLAGSAMLAHYNASKGGVVLLTQSMAVDLAPYGIRVNAVAPGFIDTPLDRKLKESQAESLVLTERTPMRRLGTIEETANAFLFLASDEASYITGTTLVVDGGHLANAGDL